MIYQVHPEHGRHIAYSQIDAEANEKNGWKTVSEAEFYKRETKEEEPEPERDIIAEHEARFGKKPHGRMTEANIIKKLDE